MQCLRRLRLETAALRWRRTDDALADRPCLEFYLNSPQTTAQEDLLTEVWAPILS